MNFSLAFGLLAVATGGLAAVVLAGMGVRGAYALQNPNMSAAERLKYVLDPTEMLIDFGTEMAFGALFEGVKALKAKAKAGKAGGKTQVPDKSEVPADTKSKTVKDKPEAKTSGGAGESKKGQGE